MAARRGEAGVQKTVGFWLQMAADAEALKRSSRLSISKIVQSLWK